jgi:signal recognition particle GTPase
MTLEDLRKLAEKNRSDTVAFCDSAGFLQTASDLMGPLEKVHKSTAIKWAYTVQTFVSPMKTDRARNTETMRVMIERMARSIDVWLYAKEHGVEAAMIWRLSRW